MDKVTMYYLVIGIILTFIFSIIAFIGGGFDLHFLLKELKGKKQDDEDDGSVNN